MNKNLIDTITDLRHNKNRKENYKKQNILVVQLYTESDREKPLNCTCIWSCTRDGQSKVQWKQQYCAKVLCRFTFSPHFFAFFEKSDIGQYKVVSFALAELYTVWFLFHFILFGSLYTLIVRTCQTLLRSTALRPVELLKVMMIVGWTLSDQWHQTIFNLWFSGKLTYRKRPFTCWPHLHNVINWPVNWRQKGLLYCPW